MPYVACAIWCSEIDVNILATAKMLTPAGDVWEVRGAARHISVEIGVAGSVDLRTRLVGSRQVKRFGEFV
jgi:hypothetical protein